MLATTSPTFAGLLRRYRRERGLTQEELAERAGLAARTISDLERGLKLRPHHETIQLLAEALALSVPERALLETIGRQHAPLSAPEPASREAPPSNGSTRSGREARAWNLPTLLTPLIGREREVAAARARLLSAGVRLLTVTGPGGIGKTCLALAVARELVDTFEDGVFFVRLANVSEPLLLVPTIAQTLGVVEGAGRPLLESLKGFLRPKSLLLVLDNFEQIIAGAAVVAELLGDCPGLTVMVTSREVLHLGGEREFAVPPLTLPDRQHLPGIERLGQYEAVALFVQRAQAVKPEFALTDDNAALIVEICQRLDGLPLAIELAAARLRGLSPRELRNWLEIRQMQQSGGARDLAVHQQAIWRTFAWSYDLLSPGEQALFRRLAVFSGGCTLEGVEAVGNAESDLDVDPFDGVASLVDKNLLVREEMAEETSRFDMYAVIREFALERLAAGGEGDKFRRHHAAYFLDYAERLEPRLRGRDMPAALDRLEREHDNLREALRFLEKAGETELGLRLAGALHWFWWQRGHLREGQRWLATFLGRPATSARTAARAKALNGAAYLMSGLGDHATAIRLGEESLGIYREVGDRDGAAWALAYLAATHHRRSESQVARTLAEESRGIFREIGNREGYVFATSYAGLAASDNRDDRAATALLEEGIVAAREIGDVDCITRTLIVLGFTALYNREDRAMAHRYFREGLGTASQLRQPYLLTYAFEGFAAASAALGQARRAVRLFQVAAAVREHSGSVPAPFWHSLLGESLEQARQALGEEAAATARAEGQAMSVPQALAYALSEEDA